MYRRDQIAKNNNDRLKSLGHLVWKKVDPSHPGHRTSGSKTPQCVVSMAQVSFPVGVLAPAEEASCSQEETLVACGFGLGGPQRLAWEECFTKFMSMVGGVCHGVFHCGHPM